jgi:hypothetical protein
MLDYNKVVCYRCGASWSKVNKYWNRDHAEQAFLVFECFGGPRDGAYLRLTPEQAQAEVVVTPHIMPVGVTPPGDAKVLLDYYKIDHTHKRLVFERTATV